MLVNYDILLMTGYAVAWLIALYVHLRKNDHVWGPAAITMLSYLVYAIIGIVLLIKGNHYADFLPLKFAPFAYLFTMLWIALIPSIQYDRAQIHSVDMPSMKWLNIFSWIYFVCTICTIGFYISNILSGMTTLLGSADGGAELYSEYQIQDAQNDNKISNLPIIFFNTFSVIACLLLIYYLVVDIKHKYIYVCGYAICVAMRFIIFLAMGTRTIIAMSFFNIVAAYMALRLLFDEKKRKWLRHIALWTAIITLIPIAVLTKSRFNEMDGGVSEGLIYYFGQAPIYFNNYGMDANGLRNGDRTANFYKQMLGMNPPNGIFDVRDTYSDMLMDDSVFSTFVGDFTLDFGPTTTAILFIIFSIVFAWASRPNTEHQIPFYKLILAYLAMTVCLQGGMYLFFYSFTEAISFIGTILFYGAFGIHYWYKNKELQASSNKAE